jgi:NADH:ubiquinone oxidoreductase subunit 4 (subunit M)
VQRAFHGGKREEWKIPDLNARHLLNFGAMMAVLLWLGLYPQSVLNTAAPALHNMQRNALTGTRAVVQTEGPQRGRVGLQGPISPDGVKPLEGSK